MEGRSITMEFEIRRREIGFSRPRLFAQRVGGLEDLIKRMDLYVKLSAHDGCVNTVHFNPTGDLLVSGSDDKQIIFWNWAQKMKKFSYYSGHEDNVFQARVMPFTNNCSVITSAADGQVRFGQIMENGRVETKQLGEHDGRVHKLAIEPGSPYIFYSCGEDGVVQRFDLRCPPATKLFTCSLLTENGHSNRNIQLNAIVIDPHNPNHFTVAGFDEYARVYDVRNYQCDASSNRDRPLDTFSPNHLIGNDNVHITGLAYSNMSELLVSYNDELVYLFQKDMGMGPNPKSIPAEKLQELDHPQAYIGHRNSQTVKGVSFFGPNDEYVISGSDCGHIFMWRKKGGELLRIMLGDMHIVNCLEPHPCMTVLATSGIEKNVKLWSPIARDIIPLPDNVKEIMESNRQGREDRSRITLTPDVIMRVLRLQRRQTFAYIERRYSRADFDFDEDGDGEAYVLGISDSDAASDEDLSSNPRECNIT
ncbi:DDB1- and CUL4-associated factor 8 [Nymphaea thermarum]|nr:DDB1- and CUL4-associated factor 8 [Nymphaea thermarum]